MTEPRSDALGVLAREPLANGHLSGRYRPGRWAVAWPLHHAAVATVIPGCPTIEQLEGNAAAAERVAGDHPLAAPALP